LIIAHPTDRARTCTHKSWRAEFEGRVMYSARPAAKLEVTQPGSVGLKAPRFGQYAAHKSHAPRRKHIKGRFPATAGRVWRDAPPGNGTHSNEGVAHSSLFGRIGK
jgi:hypothetical protein